MNNVMRIIQVQGDTVDVESSSSIIIILPLQTNQQTKKHELASRIIIHQQQ